MLSGPIKHPNAHRSHGFRHYCGVMLQDQIDCLVCEILKPIVSFSGKLGYEFGINDETQSFLSIRITATEGFIDPAGTIEDTDKYGLGNQRNSFYGYTLQESTGNSNAQCPYVISVVYPP